MIANMLNLLQTVGAEIKVVSTKVTTLTHDVILPINNWSNYKYRFAVSFYTNRGNYGKIETCTKPCASLRTKSSDNFLDFLRNISDFDSWSNFSLDVVEFYNTDGQDLNSFNITMSGLTNIVNAGAHTEDITTSRPFYPLGYSIYNKSYQQTVWLGIYFNI